MTANAETLTVRLPASALERLRRVAQISHRPIDALVADTLEASFPPLLERVPEHFRNDLATLEALPSATLRELLYAQLDSETIERYDELLARNSAGKLTSPEAEELDTLRATGDLLMYRKAYAALVLKWRGEYIPTATDLHAAQ